jgi:hypothetical protein
MGLLSRGAWSYGRAWSRAINKHGRSSKDYTQTADFLNNIINKRINTTRGMSGIELETEVLREIKRLKSEGKDGDIDAVREVVQNRFKTYHRLGPKLELEIIQKAQQKALAGEEINYAQIEREILDTPKKIPKKLTEQEEIDAQKKKYDLQEQKKLEREKKFQDKLLRKKVEREHKQVKKDEEKLRYRQEMFLAREKGRKQMETLEFKIVFAFTVILVTFFAYGLIVTFLI